MRKPTFQAAAMLAIAGMTTAAAHDTRNDAEVTLVYDHALLNEPGKSMRSVLVEYQPGGRSPTHTHPKSAFIYATVLQGWCFGAIAAVRFFRW